MDAMLNTIESATPLASDSTELTDEQLLVHYRETGRRDYFATLVRRYERELYSYLKRFLGNSEMAEDAFQATFLQVHLKVQQFAGDRRFRPWLYAIATNQAIDAKRHSQRQRTVSLDSLFRGHDHEHERGPADWMVSAEPTPGARTDSGEREEFVRRALGQLSGQMRMVIQLVYYQGLKYREAAEIMAVPVGTVKSRLHAAIARLTEYWNESQGEPD
jgi:RNA polymerase sigma-70 factor (ECF subfamily)